MTIHEIFQPKDTLIVQHGTERCLVVIEPTDPGSSVVLVRLISQIPNFNSRSSFAKIALGENDQYLWYPGPGALWECEPLAVEIKNLGIKSL